MLLCSLVEHLQVLGLTLAAFALRMLGGANPNLNPNPNSDPDPDTDPNPTHN